MMALLGSTLHLLFEVLLERFMMFACAVCNDRPSPAAYCKPSCLVLFQVAAAPNVPHGCANIFPPHCSQCLIMILLHIQDVHISGVVKVLHGYG